MADNISFCSTTIGDKRINNKRQLFDTNGAMKPWSVIKSEFIWSENSHFYWIELNNVIPKVWKENLYKGDEGLHDITSSGHHIIKKCQIYSLSKCNSKELYSLQVSLNGSKVHHKYTSKIFFKIKRLGGNVYTLCLVVWLLTLT